MQQLRGKIMENNAENAGDAPPKTAKQLEKEAKKQAKLDKLKQKLEKKQNVPVKPDVEVEGVWGDFPNICSHVKT